MAPSAARNVDLMAPPVVKTIATRAMFVGLVFGVGALIIAFLQPQQFFRAYLVGFMLCLAVTLGSMAILMLRHLTRGGWGMIIRRILGAAMRCVTLMTAFFIPLIFGVRYLYIWARPLEQIEDKHLHDHLVDITRSYLNVNGFVIRAAIYFVIWNLLSYLLTKWSREQDTPPARDNSGRFKALSGPGLILYGFTISFAAIDWIMSLDPSWTSTIYGLLILIGQVLAALCFAIIVERILFRYKPMSELLQPEHVHDHGKFMLAFTMVWAYFGFSQWLIIWAGNLPEEITWYMKRLHGGWQSMGLFLVIFGFAAPFVVLLSRSFKRDVSKLVWLAAWVLVVRYVDMLWMVEPNFSSTFTITWADVVVPIAMGGIWTAFFFRNLAAVPLVPAYDVYAGEVLEPAHEHK